MFILSIKFDQKLVHSLKYANNYYGHREEENYIIKSFYKINGRVKEKCHNCFKLNQLRTSMGYVAKKNHSVYLEEIFIKADHMMYKNKENKIKYTRKN